MADAKPRAAKAAAAPEPTQFRFVGVYPAVYLPPDHVSRVVSPGEVVDWGTDGPPDMHWEPVVTDSTTQQQPPAPTGTDSTKE